MLLESEAIVQEAQDQLGQYFILRLAGIYGPGRHYLLDQLQSGSGVIPGRGDYRMNMIHLEDIVRAIKAALSGKRLSGFTMFVMMDRKRKNRSFHFLQTDWARCRPLIPDNLPPRLRRRGVVGCLIGSSQMQKSKNTYWSPLSYPLSSRVWSIVVAVGDVW